MEADSMRRLRSHSNSKGSSKVSALVQALSGRVMVLSALGLEFSLVKELAVIRLVGFPKQFGFFVFPESGFHLSHVVQRVPGLLALPKQWSITRLSSAGSSTSAGKPRWCRS